MELTESTGSATIFATTPCTWDSTDAGSGAEPTLGSRVWPAAEVV